MMGRAALLLVAAATVARGAEKLRWDPYGGAKGGSVAACGGVDFALIAADTQLTSGYRISSSTADRVTLVSDRVALASGGCRADCDGLARALLDRCDAYGDRGGGACDASSASRACRRLLYARRGFPYDVQAVVCGLDAAGRGRAYGLDGSGGETEAAAVARGSAARLMQPVLDRLAPRRGPGAPALFEDVADAKRAVVAAFQAAAKRDTSVGGALDLAVITPAGVARETVRLDFAGE
jgi:20S proteasome subunit beta 6